MGDVNLAHCVPSSSSAVASSVEKLPRRIILVRHGESEGNVDESVFSRIADSKIPLTPRGIIQSEECGIKIRKIIESSGDPDWKVYFYVSPYKRTLETLRGIGRAFEPHRIAGVREEPRIREQDFGNFQEHGKMQELKYFRERFGKFFYRFPEGESAADVYDRVTGFLESLWRDIDMCRLKRATPDSPSELNIVLVTHGVTMRVFLTRWFKWTTEQFEALYNPCNCEIRVMQLGSGGDFSLALDHSRASLKAWGLSPYMCREQLCRRESKRGQWKEEWGLRHASFFDHFPNDKDDEACMSGETINDLTNGEGNGILRENEDEIEDSLIMCEEKHESRMTPI